MVGASFISLGGVYDFQRHASSNDSLRYNGNGHFLKASKTMFSCSVCRQRCEDFNQLARICFAVSTGISGTSRRFASSNFSCLKKYTLCYIMSVGFVVPHGKISDV